MKAADFTPSVIKNPYTFESPWKLPLAHLSASSIGMAQRCPESWRRRYILGQKERPGAALILGSAFHETLERNWTQKIESHVDLPVDDLVTFYQDEAWAKAVARDEEVAWGEEKPELTRDKGASMIHAYQTTTAERIQPLAVEKKIEIEIGLPIPVIGYVDVEREAALSEQKTSKAAQRKPKPDWLLQGRLYQMALGKPVEWHVVTKAKTPQVLTPLEAPELLLEPGEWSSTRELIAKTATVLNHLYSTLGPDEAWPGAITHPWACMFCGYRPTCHWWKP